MRLSYNDFKYNERNTGGRGALEDYLHDREYWITQGGNPALSLGDMISAMYPGKSVQDAMFEHALSFGYVNITPVFTASVTTGVAPLSVFFDASGTTAGNTPHAWRDCLFAHDSGDTASGNYTYGNRAGQSKRKLVGAGQFGHVYETPGTYTYVGKVWDGIGFVSRQIQIVVQDPDVVFSGTNTICCSTTGDFTGAPAGASLQTVANLAAAGAFLATGKRVLIQSADTWTTAATITQSGTKDQFVFGSFGGGRAVITLTSAATLFTISSANVTRFQILGIEVNGSSTGSRVVIGSTAITVTGLHLHDIYAYDLGSLYTVSGTHLTRNMTVSSTLVERVKGGGGYVGIFGAVENLVLQDSRVYDATAAEHNIRFPYIGKGFINGVEAVHCAVNKHALTIRAPLWAGGAVNGLPANSYTEYVTVSDCTFASNTAYMTTIQPQANNADERVRRVVSERNYTYAMGTTAAYGLALSSFECISRNNVYNLTGGAAYGGGVFIINNTTFTADGNESWNDTVYSGSAHTALVGLGATSGAATNSKLKNMLMYTPSATTAEVIGSTAAASTTGTGNSTNANAKTLNPLFIGPLTGISGFKLDTSSPYATNALLDKNWMDASDKIRVSNGGSHMLNSNATSAWSLFGL